MASPGYPETLNPYLTRKDCVKGFCTLYCPRWCFTISPPPPPPFEFPDDDSGPSSPSLIIAVVGILASAFLLVCYYTIISKYCGSRNRRGHQNHVPRAEFGEDNYGNSGSVQEPWHVSGQGLDESLIKSITICKFKKGVGQFEGTTCSVCLSEIVEEESIKLLPKCNHAFHVQCIDTWLKSHLNCPLCRADIVFTSSSSVQSPPPLIETPSGNESLPEIHQENQSFAVEREESTNHGADDVPKTPLRNFNVGNMEPRHTIIEMGNGNHLGFQPIRRSFSMGHCGRSRLCVEDVLRSKEHDEIQIEDCCLDNVGSPNLCVGGTKRLGYKMKLLNCVMRPAIMGRSFSCGRLSLSRHGRVQRATIPL